MRSSKKIIISLVVFFIFLFLLLYRESFLRGLKGSEYSSLHKIFNYLISICFWLSLAYLINVLIKVFFWESIVAKTIGGKVPRLLIHFVSILVFFIAITVIAVYVFEQSFAGFWATSGALAFVLGYALRNMILDLFTGLAINIERPYGIGDLIQIEVGSTNQIIAGKVIDINWRSTRLKTEEKAMVVVSNSLINNYIITNYTYPDKKSRFETHVYINPNVPVDKAKRIIESAAKMVLKEKGFYDDPEPTVVVDEINDFGVKYVARYYIYPWLGINPLVARDRVNSKILKYLELSGLSPTYPKKELYFRRKRKDFDFDNSHKQVVQILENIDLFNCLNKSELDDVAKKIKIIEFLEDQSVITEGEDGDSMFIVSEGLVGVYVFANTKNLNKVGEIGPGEFFGEMSLLTGEPRSATIKAETNTVLYEVKKEHIQKLLKDKPSIMENISKIVAARRINTQESLKNLQDSKDEKTEGLAETILKSIRDFFD